MAGRTIEMPTSNAYLRIMLRNVAPLPDSLVRDSRRLAMAVLTNMGVLQYDRAKDHPLMRRESVIKAGLDASEQLTAASEFMRTSGERIFGEFYELDDWQQTMLRTTGVMRPEVPISPFVSVYARPMMFVAKRFGRPEDYDQALEYVAGKTYLHALQERHKEQVVSNPSLSQILDAKEQAMEERLFVFGAALKLENTQVLDDIALRIHATVIKQEEINKERQTKKPVDMFENLEAYARAHRSREKKVLKLRQMHAFEDIIKAGKLGQKEGYIEAPTGFGKTVLFGEVAAAADVPTVIVVPRKRLVEQTYRSIKRFNPSLSVGRVYGDVKEFGHQVTITTYQSVTNELEDLRVPFNNAKLVILDEVDEATGNERIKAIEKIPEDAFLLGFSATPVKVSGKAHASSRVAKMMNNEIHLVTLREGVEDGYLSSFSNFIVNVDSDISGVSINEDGTYNEAALEGVINTEPHNKAAVKFFLKMRALDRRKNRNRRRGGSPEPLTTSVYASSIKHATDLAQAFRDAGVNAAAVWGTQNPKTQEEIMRKWAAGEIEVVCSKDLLIRGNDIPKIRLIMNVEPTGSYITEKQRSGRGLRIDRNNPDKHTIIADFVYQNSNRTSQQVTFAEIAGGAEMFRYVGEGVRKWVGNKRRRGKDNDNTEGDSDEFDIEGITVITDVREVMRLVKGIQATRIEDFAVQDTDFPITQTSLESVFVNGNEKRPIAEAVVIAIQMERPDIVVQRQNMGRPITVVTDREYFIEKMKEKGVMLRDNSLIPVQEGDTVINATFLFTHFVGMHKRVADLKERVLHEMQEDQPGTVAQRKNVNVITTVVTDVDLFIRRMEEKGAKRKGEIQPVVAQDDLTVTNVWLNSTFTGDVTRLRTIAYEVISQIESDHPDKVAWLKSSNTSVPIVRDKALFMQGMLQRGVSVPDATAIDVQVSDFPVTSTNLMRRFSGSYAKLKSAKDAVMGEIREENPQLVVRRKKEITVVTDADVFVRKMLEKGIKLRED